MNAIQQGYVEWMGYGYREGELKHRQAGNLDLADACRQVADVYEQGRLPIGCEYPREPFHDRFV